MWKGGNVSNVEISELAKIYTELGVLGMIAVVLVFIFIFLVAYLVRSNKTNAAFVQKMYQGILDSDAERDKNVRELISNAIEAINYHTPSNEENVKVAKLESVINEELKDLLIKTGASRTALVRYHNGTHDLNGISFSKFSITNEQFQVEEEALMPLFRDQFRAMFAEAVRQLDEKGEFIVDNVEKIRNVDNGMYNFMKGRQSRQSFQVAIHNTEGRVVGFILVAYSDRNEHIGDVKTVMPILKQKALLLEKMMNI